MEYKRSAGILAHITSLPSKYCVGDMGPGAYKFIDYLKASGASLWQILPLGPTGYGDSPYASTSTFAGNPFLISLDMLIENNFLDKGDADNPPYKGKGRVDFSCVRAWKMPLLRKAARGFIGENNSPREYQSFCTANEYWLGDFALFTALKEHFDLKAADKGGCDSRWNRFWDTDIALREVSALKRWREYLSEKIEVIKVIQFFFFRQWISLKNHANRNGIKIIGDIPVFVSEESSDFWSHRELFKGDSNGIPLVISGVPPDYFSKTGQKWGNPVYDWEMHVKEDFSWWIHRIEHLSAMVDIIRIDHFRGFVACWEIPRDDETAVNGKWIPAPGKELFSAVRERLGDVAILAEDLGVITEDVIALRDSFSFPGMKVLQFAFERNGEGKLNTENAFLPFHYSRNSVVYTGTHDNDTTRGWYSSLSDWEKDIVRRYLARSDDDMVWSLIRAGMQSVAVFALFPMQDILNLDSSGRMNLPSTVNGANWSWQMSLEDLQGYSISRFREITELYGRIG